MKVLRCDTCRADIDQDRQYFGADCFKPPQPLDPDDPESPVMLAELRVGDSEYHFCSPQCLAEWGFARSLIPVEPS